MSKVKYLRRCFPVVALILIIVCAILYITHASDYRVMVGLAYLYEISKDLNEYRKVHGNFPENYSIPKSLMKKKCLNSLHYVRKGTSTYEITATINNLLSKDVFLKANPEGVFIENRKIGRWQKWFNPVKEP